MNAISWNCRGLGATSTVQELRDLCKQLKPTIVFLMETRAKEGKVEELRRGLKFDFKYSIDSDGLLGGLCLLWNKNIDIEVVTACRNYIHTFCRDKEEGHS